MEHKTTHTEILSSMIVSKSDAMHLLREIEAIEEFLHQTKLRQPSSHMKLPRLSTTLEEIAQNYGCNLLHQDERTTLRQVFAELVKTAPVIHISFASDPSGVFLTKLLQWLRREIHPQLLLQIGLQPSIAAGCVVRTTNKYFDFSLRQHFQNKREVLVQGVRGEASEQQG